MRAHTWEKFQAPSRRALKHGLSAWPAWYFQQIFRHFGNKRLTSSEYARKLRTIYKLIKALHLEWMTQLVFIQNAYG